jgi:hypothetical protein
MDTRNLPKPVKMALKMKDKVAKCPDEPQKWIKDLNPELHTENWMVLDMQPEPQGSMKVPRRLSIRFS